MEIFWVVYSSLIMNTLAYHPEKQSLWTLSKSSFFMVRFMPWMTQATFPVVRQLSIQRLWDVTWESRRMTMCRTSPDTLISITQQVGLSLSLSDPFSIILVLKYGTGTLRAFLSGKISYTFGWSGPSIVVDTACSSSLVSVVMACRALAQGDCTAALAGGVNAITSPDVRPQCPSSGSLSY